MSSPIEQKQNMQTNGLARANRNSKSGTIGVTTSKT